MTGFRAAVETSDRRLQLFTEFLDSPRFSEPANLRRMELTPREKYASTHIELTIALSPPALRFMLEHRSNLFAGVPLIFALASAQELPPEPLPADVLVVLDRFDPAKTLELARRLQPEARHAVVVSGSDSFDRMWEGIARKDLQTQLAGLEVR